MKFCKFGNKDMSVLVVKVPGETALVLRFCKSTLLVGWLRNRTGELAVSLFPMGYSERLIVRCHPWSRCDTLPMCLPCYSR